jgi:tol-pal system protein YbgF
MTFIIRKFFPEGAMRLQLCFIAGILLTTSGCANQDVIVQKQSEMEARLEYLAQNNKSLAMQVTGLAGEVRELKERSQNNLLAIQELKESSRNTAGRDASISADNTPSPPLQPAAAKIELINNEATAGQKNDTASSLYMTAFGLYSANKYPAAIKAFNAFLEKHPDTEFAVNAQYWIGECYYSQSDLPRSLEAFKKVVEKYPKGKKAPDALLKIGYTLFALKEPVQAKAALALLVEKFPNSSAAEKAREKLASR